MKTLTLLVLIWSAYGNLDKLEAGVLQPSCPSGTTSQASNYGQTGSQPRRANFCTGKSAGTCSFCAPAGGQVSSLPAGNFLISPQCTLVGDSNGNSEWWGGFGYGSISGSWVGQGVQISYSNAYSGIGYLEVCGQNGYASFTVQIVNSTTQSCPASVPSSGAACTYNGPSCGYNRQCFCGGTQCLYEYQAFCSGGTWKVGIADPAPCPVTCPTNVPQGGTACQGTPNNQACGYDLFCCPGGINCLNTTQAFCLSGQWQLAAADPAPCPVCNSLPQSYTIPSTMSNFSVWQDPRIRRITCGSAISACKVCPKPTSSPIPAGPWSVDVNCPSGTTVQSKTANTFGYGTWTINWTNTGTSGTISKPSPPYNYGWIRTEFCDSSNAYGSWVLFY